MGCSMGLRGLGWLGFATDSFTKPDGQTIAYKKVSLTYEGQTLAPGVPLGVLLRGEADAGAKGRWCETAVAEEGSTGECRVAGRFYPG